MFSKKGLNSSSDGGALGVRLLQCERKHSFGYSVLCLSSSYTAL